MGLSMNSHQDRLFRDADFACSFCGRRDGTNLTIDHIMRSSEGGADTFENMIALCRPCHLIADGDDRTEADGMKKRLRRLKRHQVQKWLTRPGINLLKLALKTRPYGVAGLGSLVHHLVEEGLVRPGQSLFHVGGTPAGPKTSTLIDYTITEKGIEWCKLWLDDRDLA